MNNAAQTRTSRFELTLSSTSLLPGLLGLNTAALLALDYFGAIPQWLKGAVSLFLSF